MKPYKWMTQDSKYWSVYTMKSFIFFQNNYSYDGELPICHSAENLMRFAELEGKQASIFLRVYNNLYFK